MKLMKGKISMQAADYLKMPYGRTVFPDSDGTYRAEIIEFTGCIATGDTAAEALANLENAAEGWLDIVLEKKQHVPEPLNVGQCSGKLMLRLPKTLHKQAANLAAREGTSLNQLIVVCLAERLGVSKSTHTLAPWTFVSHLTNSLSIMYVDLNHGSINTATAPPTRALANWNPVETSHA